MKLLIPIILFTFFNMVLYAQDEVWQQIIEEKVPKEYRMSAALYQLGKYALHDEEKAWKKAKGMNMWCNESNNRINIEIVYKELPAAIDSGFINNIELIFADAFWKNRASCWIQLRDLFKLNDILPDDHIIKAVTKPDQDDQGPTLQNSQSYINSGKDGSGIKIAVIDSGFDTMNVAQNQGTAPPSVTITDYLPGGLNDGNKHGTACLETVYDHAPGAQYFIYRVGNVTHSGNAVNDAINNGVDIISHSLSRYNTGWEDDSGPACSYAKDAADNGILFFTSAGNRATTHYQNPFFDTDNDDFHEWISGGGETNYITLSAGASANFYLCWNTTGGSANYNLFIIDSASGSTIGSSAGLFGFEEVSGIAAPSSAPRTVGVRVKHASGAKTTIELFVHVTGGSNGLRISVPASSSTSPSNSTAPNVISVGAVSRFLYDTIPGTNGIIEGFSSQGPTNSSNIAPDIVAPDGTTTLSNGNFFGTSGSTPNAAGMAAAFWSAHPYLSSGGVRMILFRKAQLYNDWGATGDDNIYGRGGVYLYDYFNNTKYLLRSAGNVIGYPYLPYYSVSQAQAGTPANGRVVVLGQNYPEPVLLDKKLLWISIMENAGLGY